MCQGLLSLKFCIKLPTFSISNNIEFSRHMTRTDPKIACILGNSGVPVCSNIESANTGHTYKSFYNAHRNTQKEKDAQTSVLNTIHFLCQINMHPDKSINCN